jgi:stearoyl-CoA desaturase (delta-9 desaturase)
MRAADDSSEVAASPRNASTRKPSLIIRQRQVVRAHRLSSLAMVSLGLSGVAAAPFYVAYVRFTIVDAVLFASMYWLTLGPGLCVGFHRHFTHGAFQASPAVRVCLAVLGSMSAQGPLAYWVAVHRRHHEHSDEEGDPHSPHTGGGGWRGLWRAHFGWSLEFGAPNGAHYCPDILREPHLMAVNRRYRTCVALGLALPTAVGGLVAGTWTGALGGLIWGGLVRMFLTSNATWSLNSFCHRFGQRPFATRDKSHNNAWLALPTLGESWHNNHHAFPHAAAHGHGLKQLDLNYLAIAALEKLGLVRHVKRARRAG